ncbi:exodeoxyribonuclease III [Virgibacillus halodenitrificans]|uniref:Exodeoxyribonuclease III n=1 Tax=Virgibacillus halodenitrificans TaxID=1482 RepID=A0ABR7VQI2_VIRHA|nr:exodeoxyribonuclease III [Virgibacillus halodenitrificans]MBD1223022.1 exodeoxyribonuclease III [Virgibacillus halodenitrificans]WHX25294.1 exodeoxyribonuclease III [Virgibacillus halodenitrificans]
MKIVSWNVNGIRACVRKGFIEYFHEIDADIFCLQETKLQEGQIKLDLPGYYQYWNYAERKGYSGTAIFTKEKPQQVTYGLSDEESEIEGRIITLEYANFYLVNVYTPNSKRDLTRLEERLEWEDKLYEYLKQLDANKPVIYCGDLNVAHQEIDLRNYKTNHGNSGFTLEERGKMTRLLDEGGFIDTLRYFYKDTEGLYTWWSYMKTIRERNIGWRIDYLIVSERLAGLLIDSQIHVEVMGSDHCPVMLKINQPT